MKKARCLLRPAATALYCAGAVGAVGAFAADPLDEDLIQDRNRLRVGARFSFGIGAELDNRSIPHPAAPDYHDGFVRPDLNGGADDTTWYWGYQDPSQVVGDDLLMHTATGSPSDGTTANADEYMQAGFEVIYGRELGRLTLGRRHLPWGLEAGVSSLNPKIEFNNNYNGLVSINTASFALNGVLPPRAPYEGTFEGPGPLLGLTPHDTWTDTASGSSKVHATVDSLLVGLKLGPFLEFPVNDKLQINLSAGVAALAAFNDFKFDESVTVPSIPGGALSRSGEVNEDSFVFGAYAQVDLSYAITEFLSLYVGAQYQYMDTVQIEGDGKEVTLDFSSAIEAVIGVRTSF